MTDNKSTSKKIAKIAYSALSSKKGEDIQILDISQISMIADYFVIASGSNISQLEALRDNVEEMLEKEGYKLKNAEGMRRGSGWILLDYQDVVIHIFSNDLGRCN